MKRLFLVSFFACGSILAQLGGPLTSTGGGSGDALVANPLSQFASTSSSQFKGVISDENAPDGASSKVIFALGSLSIASGKTATFSNTLTFTGTDSSSVAFGAGGTVLYNGGAGGTPSSITLTNGTGLPISTGVSGLGTNVATFLGTPSSANLAAALTDETGTGAAVFAGGPTFANAFSNYFGSAAGTDALFSATSPAVITTGQTGNNAIYRAADAVAGSSVAGANAGGNVTVTSGDAKRLTSGSAAGGITTITTGAGIGGGGAGSLNLGIGGATKWVLQGSGSQVGTLVAQTDNTIDIGASGAQRPRDIFLGRNLVYSGLQATGAAAPTIASATTIAPTTPIVFVSGTTNVVTITPPAPIASGGGQITIIPTGVFATTTGGNIALASTSVVSKALIMTFDVTTTKWYPSY